MNVGAVVGRLAGLAAGAAREDLFEQLAEGRRPLGVDAAREVEPGKADRAGVFLGDAHQLAGVVAAPPIRIHQRLVGVEHLAETGFRLPVAGIDVGMQPASQPAIRPLDLARRRPALNA